MQVFKIYYDYYLGEYCVCLWMNGNFAVILDYYGERHMVHFNHVQYQLSKNQTMKRRKLGFKRRLSRLWCALLYWKWFSDEYNYRRVGVKGPAEMITDLIELRHNEMSEEDSNWEKCSDFYYRFGRVLWWYRKKVVTQ